VLAAAALAVLVALQDRWQPPCQQHVRPALQESAAGRLRCLCCLQ
jgi:hypothetical protein